MLLGVIIASGAGAVRVGIAVTAERSPRLPRRLRRERTEAMAAPGFFTPQRPAGSTSGPPLHARHGQPVASAGEADRRRHRSRARDGLRAAAKCSSSTTARQGGQPSSRRSSTGRRAAGGAGRRAVERRRGAEGLREGLVDFIGRHEGRDVYLCWKLGEERITHWHELNAGFAGRKPVLAAEGTREGERRKATPFHL